MTTAMVGYWVATTLVAVAFLVPGVGNLVHTPQIAHDMAHLGYPSYFLTVLGCWKILGAITITIPRLPRLKEWAYAGAFFNMTGAAASHFFANDYGPYAWHVIINLVFAGVVIASWALRPQSRTLGDLLK